MTLTRLRIGFCVWQNRGFPTKGVLHTKYLYIYIAVYWFSTLSCGCLVAVGYSKSITTSMSAKYITIIQYNVKNSLSLSNCGSDEVDPELEDFLLYC